MAICAEQIRSYRLHAHHLDRKIPISEMTVAAGVCGVQNSPPGAWETALFNRLTDCSTDALRDALYCEKTLLQAWSYRGAPVVFPSAERDVFLTALIARDDEQPWIYTRGVSSALDHMHMSFDDLLMRTKEAVRYLDAHTIQSKEALDRTLSEIIAEGLPADKRMLWHAPSMYGRPDKQTVGDAVVSFLLRPCAFHSLVVFGERQGTSPTFTSLQRWLGRPPAHMADAEKALVRKFLRAYGPSVPDHFMHWLGCSKRQAHRLWQGVADEMAPLDVGGKTAFILSDDVDRLRLAESDDEALVLLGAHDPYLDLRDRAVILPDVQRQRLVWKTVANPGAVLKGGRIIGIWKTKKQNDKLDVSIALWETLTPLEAQTLQKRAEAYAGFRALTMRTYRVATL